MDLRWLVLQAQSLEDKLNVLLEYRDLTGCDNLIEELLMEQDVLPQIDDDTVAVASDGKHWLCLKENTPFLVER